jgi:hydroxymethylglutaryl-CoA reductase (NADPH)
MPATPVSPRTRLLLRPVRAVLRPLATHSASSPIETIVLLSVVGTLAYFHILSAIKHSAFFAPAAPSTLRPAHALHRDNEWVGVREGAWFDAVDSSATTVEVQQLIFSLDSAPGLKTNGVSALVYLYVLFSLRHCRSLSLLP